MDWGADKDNKFPLSYGPPAGRGGAELGTWYGYDTRRADPQKLSASTRFIKPSQHNVQRAIKLSRDIKPMGLQHVQFADNHLPVIDLDQYLYGLLHWTSSRRPVFRRICLNDKSDSYHVFRNRKPDR